MSPDPPLLSSFNNYSPVLAIPQLSNMSLLDMNVHHPAWGGPGTRIDDASTELLEIIDHHEIELATEDGLVTWQRGQSMSTIDLVFLSANLFNRMVLYERADDIQHDSDHWPIRTQLDIQTPVNVPLERRNWAATDIKLLHKSLEWDLTTPKHSKASKPCIELATATLIRTVQHAIKQSTPLARPSAWSNPNFTPECKEAVRMCRRLQSPVLQHSQPMDLAGLFTCSTSQKTSGQQDSTPRAPPSCATSHGTRP